MPTISHHRTNLVKVLLTLVLSLGYIPLVSASGMLELQSRIDQLEQRFQTDLHGWKAHIGDDSAMAEVHFDDSAWPSVDIGFEWEPPHSICWFRRWIEVPEQVGGVPAKGAQLVLRMNVDNGGAIYVNGELKQENFDWADGRVILSDAAQPGDRYLVAIRGINRPGWGVLKGAALESSASLAILPNTVAFLDEVKLAISMVQSDKGSKKWIKGINQALDGLAFEQLAQGNANAYLESIKKAENVFQEKVISQIRRRTEAKLQDLQKPIKSLESFIRTGENQHLDLSYQKVTLTMAQQLDVHARKDLASTRLRIVNRAKWNVDWVRNAVNRSLEEAKDIVIKNASVHIVPRYTTGEINIKNGAFYQNDYPMFFVGMGHFGQVRKDIPLFQDYGFNIAQIVVSVSAVLPNETDINEQVIQDLIATLDNAAKHNVAIDLLIEPHGWPRWATEKYPELMCETTNFLKYKIDHPKAQDILKKYLTALVPRIADHPALFSYCLFNEPGYADYSEFSHTKFQTWLKEKHTTIETLNKRHGSTFTSFESIPLPDGILSVITRGEKPNLASGAAAQEPLLYEWYRFNHDRFSKAHHWVMDTLRELDSDTPVHSKVQGNLFDSYPTFATGIDHERWTDATDIAGNDNWSYYRSWTQHDKSISGDYATNWWRQAMYYDFQRSVAPSKPLFNSENHPIEDDTPIWVAGRHIRTVYWQGAIHGQGATTTWVWEEDDGASLEDNIMTRANCTHALGTVGLDLLRLSEEIVALQQAESKIALLVVPSSIPFAETYLNAMKGAFEGLHFLGAPVSFVTEHQVKEGALSNFGAIIVPEAMRISDELVNNIDTYVKQGGTIVVVGDSFNSDEYGLSRTRPQFLQAKSSITRYGKGRVLYRKSMTVDEYQKLGETLMNDLEVARPIRVSNQNGQHVPGVEYRSVPYKQGYLVNLVHYGTHELPVQLTAPSGINRVVNLFDDAIVSDVFEIEPLSPMLLYVETAR